VGREASRPPALVTSTDQLVMSNLMAGVTSCARPSWVISGWQRLVMRQGCHVVAACTDTGSVGHVGTSLVEALSGYERNHLVSHLVGSGLVEELHRLLWLSDQTPGGTPVNVWYVARESTGELAAYLDDIRLASDVAEAEIHRQLAAGAPATALVTFHRYALVTATVNSSADNIAPGLLSAVVDGGVWPPAQALAYARRVPEAPSRAEALAAVLRAGAPGFDALAEEAVATVREVAHHLHRTRAAAAVLGALDDDRRAALLAKTLDLVGAVTDEHWRATDLIALAPALSPDEVPEALALAGGIASPDTVAPVLAALIDRMPDPFVTAVMARTPDIDEQARAFASRPVAASLEGRELLDVLWRGVDGWRIRVLARLAAPISQSLLECALPVAHVIEDPVARSWTVSSLVPHLAGDAQREQVAALLALAEEHADDPEVVAAVAEIEAHLSTDERNRAFVIAAEAATSLVGLRTLAILAARIHEPMREHVFTDLTRIMIEGAADEDFAAAVLHELAPYVPAPYGALMVGAARRLRAPAAAARGLRAVVPLAPADERDDLVRAALAAACAITDENRRAEELEALAPLLPPKLAVEAEAAAHHFDTDVLRYRVQTALWPYLPPGTRGRAFVDSFADRASAGPSSAMVDILAAATFTPMLPAPVVVDLLAVTAGLGDPDERADTLTALLPHAAAANVSPPADLIDDVIRHALSITDPRRRAIALVQLARWLPEPLDLPLWTVAVTDAGTIAGLADNDEAEGARRRVLVTVAAAVPGDFSEALAATARRLPTDAGRIRWMPDHVQGLGQFATTLSPSWGERAAVLAALADRCPDTGLARLVTAAEYVGDVYRQADALTALGALLPPDGSLDNHILRLIGAGEDDYARAYLLPSLVADGQRVPVDEVLAEVVRIRDASLRATALAALTPHADEATRAKIAAEIGSLPDRGWRAYAHAQSGLLLSGDTLAETSRHLWDLDGDIMQPSALEALAPRLPDPLMREAVGRALALPDPRSATFALQHLAAGMSDAVLEHTYREASVSGDHARLVAVTAALAARLPARLLGPAVEVLVDAPEGAREDARRGLRDLAPRLPDDVRRRALTRAAAATPTAWRAEAMVALVLGLPEPDLASWYRRAFEATTALPADWSRDETLSTLLSVAPPDLRRDGVAAAATIGNPLKRFVTAARLAAALPDPERRAVLDGLWRDIGDLELSMRGWVLTTVFAYLPPGRRGAARHIMLDAARAAATDLDRQFAITRFVDANPATPDGDVALGLAAVAQSIGDPRYRHPALAACAPALVLHATALAEPVWEAVRTRSADRRRAEVLGDLAATAPVLAALGGDRFAAALAAATLDVVRWWP
jgi:hypothetical protein